MTAALILPISGPYTGTYNVFGLGMQNDDGWELRLTIHGQEMGATDQYAKTLLEGIYQGEDWRIRFTGLEWTEGLVLAMLTFGAVASQEGGGNSNYLVPTLSGTFQGPSGSFAKSVAGDRMSRYAPMLGLVLNAVLGFPPTTPQSLTALLAIPAPEMQTQFNLTSKARELPLEMCLLPYNTSFGSSTFAIPFSST